MWIIFHSIAYGSADSREITTRIHGFYRFGVVWWACLTACLWCERVVTKCLLVQPLNLSFFIYHRLFLRDHLISHFRAKRNRKREQERGREWSLHSMWWWQQPIHTIRKNNPMSTIATKTKRTNDNSNDNNTAKYMSFARSPVIYCCEIFIYVFAIPADFKYHWICDPFTCLFILISLIFFLQFGHGFSVHTTTATMKCSDRDVNRYEIQRD